MVLSNRDAFLSIDTSRIDELFQRIGVFYKSVDLRIAAIYQNKQWYNCRSVVLFSHSQFQDSSQSVMVNTENFGIFRFSVKAEDMMNVLKETLATGRLCIADYTFIFGGKNDPLPLLTYEGWVSRNSERSRERFGIEWPADYFKWDLNHELSNSLSSIFDEIDTKVKCLDPPYESVYDLVRSSMKIPLYDFTYSSNANRSVLYLIFPIFLAIDECSLDGNRFECNIRFHESIDPPSISISVIGKGPSTKRKKLDFLEVRTLEKPILAAKTSTILDDVSDVRIFLCSENKPVGAIDEKELRNRRSNINQRLIAHEVFDGGSETFQEMLSAKKKHNESGNFEWSVATLLHFSGFQSELLGSRDLGDVPDILAFYPDGNVLIVGECTLKVPDNSKVSALLERSKRLRESINVEVLPVIFSNVEMKSLQDIPPAEVKKLGSEKLKEIFDMVSRGASTREIYDRIFRW